MPKSRTTRKTKKKRKPKETIRLPECARRDISFRENLSPVDMLIQLMFLVKDHKKSVERKKRSDEIYRAARGRDRQE